MQRVIHLDLPSAETARQKTRLDDVRKLFGKTVPERSGRERVILSSMAVVIGLAEGLRLAGIDDVVRFEIDGQVIVEDVHNEANDLPFIVTQALGAIDLERPFERMELVAKDEVAGATLTLTGYVTAEVDKGAEELRLNCATSRPVAIKALDGRVQVIARALSKAFEGARFRIVS